MSKAEGRDRAAAVHACHRVGLIPVYMEDFPPDPRDAIAVCKAKVEEADLFLGIYAHRYGYVPDDSELSITEMEYDWAIERNLPVYLFVIDSDYPWPVSQVDKGKNSERLDLFKKRIGKHKWKTFQDVGAFKEDVLLLGHDLVRANEATSPSTKSTLARRSLPTPPEMHSVPLYIQTIRFIGRRKELNDLAAWARSSDTMLVVEAIGGVGKSALTWEWTRELATTTIPELAGIFWWSFYEGGASTASFVQEALAYVTEVDPEDLIAVAYNEQAQRLLTELRRRPYLLVLDGFERLLTAYHQIDPSKLLDDQIQLDHRACTNPLTEDLILQLTTCSPSKVLLTTRLIPLALENRGHQMVPGVCHLKLQGLDPGDGENLLTSLGIHGDSAAIRQFLRQFDNHSLLIGVLIGRILDYRPAPKDFDRWLADPNEGGGLRLSELDLKQRRTHILAYAFKGLDSQSRKLLGRIAVLSDAADYTLISILNPYLPPPPKEVPVPLLDSLEWGLDTLREKRQAHPSRATRALLQEQLTVRMAELDKKRAQQKAAEDKNQNRLKTYLASPEYRAALTSFDAALSNLENRNLLQWDRHNNTYDLHPVIRAYVFDQLDDSDKINVYERIRDHFASFPPENLEEATELSQIRHTIQMYRALVGASQLDLAADLYMKRLAEPLFLSITSYPTVVELLSPMFPNGLQPRSNSTMVEPPPLLTVHSQSFVAYALGYALRMSGRPREAKHLEELKIDLDLKSKDWQSLAAALDNYSRTLLHTNSLATALNLSKIAQEFFQMLGNESGLTGSLLVTANIYSIEGRWEEAHTAYKEFSARPIPDRRDYRSGSFEANLCQLKFWEGSLQAGELEDALLVAIRGRSLLESG